MHQIAVLITLMLMLLPCIAEDNNPIRPEVSNNEALSSVHFAIAFSNSVLILDNYKYTLLVFLKILLCLFE